MSDSLLDRHQKRRESEYYIDRYGKIHKFKGDISTFMCSVHAEIAGELYPNMPDPKTFLMKQGWILVGSNVYSSPYANRMPTQSQINTMSRLYILDLFHISHNGRLYLFKEFEELQNQQRY